MNHWLFQGANAIRPGRAFAVFLPLMACICFGGVDKHKIQPKDGAVILFNNDNSHIWIRAIDDDHMIKAHGLYELAPGNHVVRASLYYEKNRIITESHTYVDCAFTAKAGAVLNVVCDETTTSYGSNSKGTWKMWIEDVATGRDIRDASFRAADQREEDQAHERQLEANFAETRRKAEQGDVESLYALGLCYERGDGVAPNSEEASKWYRKAGEKGHATAQFMLGMDYDIGQGVAPDRVEAYAWFSLAAQSGDPSASYFRDEDEKLLSPEQLDQAKARLKKLLETIGSGHSGL